jgi:heat shock protein HslJ
MRTLLIWILLFTALLGTIGYLLVQRDGFPNPFRTDNSPEVASTTPPVTFDQATVYTCAGGSVVAAAFKTGDTSVIELSLPDTNPQILTATESASGARYRNETGLSFWEKDGRALVENETGVLFAECIARGAEVPPSEIATTTPNELTGTQWVWVETVFATGTAVTPNNPEDFILTFAENNRFSANTDCNNMGGGYNGGEDGALSFSEMMSTLMACEGDIKEGVFSSQLAQVVSYKIAGDELVLSLKNDAENGERKFTKQ